MTKIEVRKYRVIEEVGTKLITRAGFVIFGSLILAYFLFIWL